MPVPTVLSKKINWGGTADFVLHRVGIQQEHLEEIANIFGDKVRAMVPLFETEVKGAEMLKRTGDHLFA